MALVRLSNTTRICLISNDPKVPARVIFQTELQDRMQETLWKSERDHPMPRFCDDFNQQRGRECEAIIAAKVAQFTPV